METLAPAPIDRRPRVAVRPARRRTPEWVIATGLIMLSLVPAIAGSARLVEIGGAATITPDNARFIASPIPVTVHIIASVLYSIAGAFQFLPRFRARHMRWHRTAGYVLLACGALSAGSGLWMTLYYPWTGFDGEAVYVMRLLAGTSMLLALGLGAANARRRNVAGHRAWMMRAYALGVAAGSQVFTHIPLLLLPDHLNELTRAIAMGAGWAINLAVAEWLIHRPRGRRPGTARVPESGLDIHEAAIRATPAR